MSALVCDELFEHGTNRGLRFSEGHRAPPKDWTERTLLEISFAGGNFLTGRRWLSVGVWVSRGNIWCFTCPINCDDIVLTKWRSVRLMKDGETITEFPFSETLLSISDWIGSERPYGFEALSSTALFREGVE